MRVWLHRLAIMFCVTLVTPRARAENYAFLVAVQDYDVKDLKPLNYTRGDIEAFAKTLLKSGFKPENIVVLNDKPDKARFMAESGKIRTQLDLLLGAVEAKDTLIVAFSGHGVQFEGSDKNYYCPLDANLDDPKRTSLIAMSEIYEKLKQCPAEKKLLLVDACRNDPLSSVKKSRATVTLKSVTRPQTEAVPKGVVALFSCSAGQESYEWPQLKHGIFFHHILEGWNGGAADDTKTVTLDGLVAYSKLKTQSFARLNLNALQTPQLKSDFEGTWVLRKEESSSAGKELTNTIGMKLMLIPAGEFSMGSPASEVGQAKWEQQHQVRISQSFYLGKYEVTRGEFRKFVEATNYKTDAEKDGKGGYGYSSNEKLPYIQKLEFTWRNAGFEQTDEHPVVNVSWNDAVEFCKWLSVKEGKAYRLPTEAEWEYACRATTNTRWSSGAEESHLARVANTADSSLKSKNGFFSSASSWDDGFIFTAPVGKFGENQFGLHDMHGNVWEWCSDRFDRDYYAKSPASDPVGSDYGAKRVARGGGWTDRPAKCYSAARSIFSPWYRVNAIGFRVVSSPDGQPLSKPVDMDIVNRLGMRLAPIPPGEFLMGNETSVDELVRLFPGTRQEWLEDAVPLHRVRITKPFYLGKHEVTRGQFRKFVEATGYKTEPEQDGQGGKGYDVASKQFEGRKPKYTWRTTGFDQTDEHPVVNITYNDAIRFCEWLSKIELHVYRLPTEAEWEYACRGGTNTRYQGGGDAESLAAYGNVADLTAKAVYGSSNGIGVSDGFAFTAPVGRLRPNGFGLYDMHGNVWERCSDWYDAKYYARSPTDDPRGPESGSSQVSRGGAWGDGAVFIRSSNRGNDSPSHRNFNLGFRVALSPELIVKSTVSSATQKSQP